MKINKLKSICSNKIEYMKTAIKYNAGRLTGRHRKIKLRLNAGHYNDK